MFYTLGTACSSSTSVAPRTRRFASTRRTVQLSPTMMAKTCIFDWVKIRRCFQKQKWVF